MNSKGNAVIVGGTGDVGGEIMVKLSQSGYNCYVVANEGEERLDSIDKVRLGTKYIKCDITDYESIENMVSELPDEINVLVNAAGVSVWDSVDDIRVVAWNKVFNTNVRGIALVVQEMLPLLKKADSARILNITSAPIEGMLSFTTAGAAVVKLTKIMARQLAEYNITVNSLQLGLIEGRFIKNMEELGKYNQGAIEKAKSGYPFGIGTIDTYSTVSGIAMKIIDSEYPNWITGTNFVIDGGRFIAGGAVL